MIFVVMGVSGCGKTTVGCLLAKHLNCNFYDADDYHPRVNIEKMASGHPLDDNDRLPWLRHLNEMLLEHSKSGDYVVLACSALKQKYREYLSEGIGQLDFIYLKGDYGVIIERMRLRKEHYMKADMLRSQFEALEEPDSTLNIDIRKTPGNIVSEIIDYFELR
jgi:carbohydrate kinase (thermoresistant glucokinase family)